jgi:hypothetical protein
MRLSGLDNLADRESRRTGFPDFILDYFTHGSVGIDQNQTVRETLPAVPELAELEVRSRHDPPTGFSQLGVRPNFEQTTSRYAEGLAFTAVRA